LRWARGGLPGLQAQDAVDLATRQPLAQQLACRHFHLAQGLGQAQLRLEIAMVDGADLPREGAPRKGRFAAGERGHALD